MDSTKILSLLEQLDDEVDDLQESLEPLLKTALSETSSKLPLLDKAKLYVLVTYAIESVLFSYLRLNGVNAREHPVFTELTRVKQYFEKIKKIEFPPEKKAKAMNLDKKAAARFITASLAGNDRYDLEKREQMAKERAKAHIKFLELEKKRKVPEKEEEEDDDEDSSSESDSDSASPVPSPKQPKLEGKPKKKKQKLGSKPSSGASTPKSTLKDLKDDFMSLGEDGVQEEQATPKGKKGKRSKNSKKFTPKGGKQNRKSNNK